MQSLSSRPFLTGSTLYSLASPSLPFISTSPLLGRHWRWPRQIRSITNPPTKSTVEAVRELAAVALTHKKELLEPSNPFVVSVVEAPKFYAMMKDDWGEKKRHWWRSWHAKAYRESHKELSDILTTDSRKRRPHWTAQERELCKRWLKDVGSILVTGGKTLDVLQNGGVVFTAYMLCQWVLGSA